MERSKTRWLVFIFAVGLLISQSIHAQHVVPQSVFGNGGARLANSNYQINGTLGQPVNGVVSGSSHSNYGGFWYFSSETADSILGDLTIGWIGRLPETDYVWGSTNPSVEGWPAVGQQIAWRAHIKNWSTIDRQGVPYKWYLDGVETASGSVAIPAGASVGVDYPWTWTFDRHELKFVIDPNNIVPEEEEQNNTLLIHTNAISVGFYVEQSLYNYFREHQHKLGVRSNCWEDWAQRQVRRWNEMFANARYPETSNGVLDRIRLDKITIVPDGALPLAGGLPTNHPNLNDKTVDLQWGFPAAHLQSDFYKDHTTVSDRNAFYYEGSLIHELGHARYLIDVYGFNVHDNGQGNTVAIKENGELIVGTEYMPFVALDAVYYTPEQGLMNSEYTRVDRYSATALNLIAGHRATLGNYNSPGNIGVFLNRDLPDENRLTVKGKSGQILVTANVKIYQAARQEGVWYGKYYDDVPDIELTTDRNGQVLLGRCPFDDDGTIDHGPGLANGTLIIRVEHSGQVAYTFLDATQFNLEYWRGKTSLGDYEINVNIIETPAIAWQADLTVSDAGNETATLTFGQAPSATDGRDPFLGEAEIPPPPPTGIFDARFELPVSPSIDSRKDFRNDTLKTAVWKIKYQAGTAGFPVTLSWKRAELPAGNFCLKDLFGGIIVNVNMKDRENLPVTNSAITSLIIEMTKIISDTVEVPVTADWNIISVPLLADNMHVDSLFPGAASEAFRFDSNKGYVVADILSNGVGYWLKFTNPDTFKIIGQKVTPKEISVKAGWNMIGPFESLVQVPEITSEPNGIVQSAFFEFDNGYKSATTLQPGKGYWVKVGQDGKLLLPDGSALGKSAEVPIAAASGQDEISSWPTIRIEDSKGQTAMLYLSSRDELGEDFELPPLPPAGIFDVRYSTGRYVENLYEANWEVLISSAHYPIKIKAENFGATVLRMMDDIGGKVLNETVADGKAIEIARALDKLLLKTAEPVLLPVHYELARNYPNPFNPTTVIKYALPEAGRVKISVYNILGEKVADLVDAELPAGYHQVEINATSYASGVYFYVMKAGEFKAVKKMAIMK